MCFLPLFVETWKGQKLWETNSCLVFWDLELAQTTKWFILLPYLDGGNWVDFRSLNVQVKVLRSTQLSFPVPFWRGLLGNDPQSSGVNYIRWSSGSSNVSWKLRHKVHIHIGKKKKISSQSHVCLHVFCLVLNSGSLNAQRLPSLNSPSDNPTHRPGGPGFWIVIIAVLKGHVTFSKKSKEDELRGEVPFGKIVVESWSYYKLFST